MKKWTRFWLHEIGGLHRALVSLSAMIIIGLSIFAIGAYLDSRHEAANREAVQKHTERDVRFIHLALSARIEADFQAARQMADAILAQPNMSADQMRTLAQTWLQERQHFISISFAPQFVLKSVHTMARPAGDPSMPIPVPAVGDVVAPGPLPRLVRESGGRLAFYFPVAIKNADKESGWGAIVVHVDEARFFEASGIKAPPGASRGKLIDLAHLDIGFRDVGAGSTDPFLGPFSLSDRQPTTATLEFPGGNWEIMAVPQAGWDAASDGDLPFRQMVIVAGLAMFVPIFVAILLINDRNRNIAKLRTRKNKLLELSQRFNLAMESSNIGIWEVRESDHRLLWDKRSAALHGFEAMAGEDDDRMADWRLVLHDGDRRQAESHFDLCASTTLKSEDTYRVVLKDGTVRYLRSVGAYSGGDDGEGRTIGIVWDVSADVRANQTLRSANETSEIKNAELELALDELSSREQQLEELSHKFDLALASYNCGIWEADPKTKMAYWDERMHQLYGLPSSNKPLSQSDWMRCIHPSERSAVLNATNNAILNERTMNTLQRVQLPSGELRYVRSVGQLHKGRGGAQKIVGIAFDVTADVLLTEQLKAAKQEADARNVELELAKGRIEHNSLHDPLTGLANRRKLDIELDALSNGSEARRLKFSILHLDLDRFKDINDTLGHAAGDAVLVQAARILKRNLAPGDMAARIGGDEFVILAKSTTNADELATLSTRIIDEMSLPIDFEGFSCRCGVSIGIAQAYGTMIDARKILINADIALYQAKATGRNCYEFFTQNLQANIVNNKRMADEMLEGLERDEFTAWYQPQFDANTLQLTGAEALVRWNHPERGILASSTFLKIAEELNVMARIDQIVLERSLKDKMRWAALGIRIPKISVNVSAKRLNNSELMDSLRGLDLSPGELCFELVESIIRDKNEPASIANIERIKALGIDIEIDDFGTGQTSIVSLLKLKPKRLKIDQQLVMPIVDSPQERALVRSIIDIARTLGVETIAEGVETREHADMLRQLGCDGLQGYFFARPLPFQQFSKLAVEAPWRKAS